MSTRIEWADASRVVASNGYILVYVGKEHHLADVRGYAYEHRLVAEQMLGRRLAAGEIVHHRNGDKADNRPANIEVKPSIKHHCAEHRRRTDLQGPDEPNELVQCLCGCGGEFLRYDVWGRPRRYLPDHYPPKRRAS